MAEHLADAEVHLVGRELRQQDADDLERRQRPGGRRGVDLLLCSSRFPVPEPSSEEPYDTYLQRGERLGPHCVHENHANQLYSSDKIYATYCNAGLRIFDISDAANPVESASFVPPDPSGIVDPRPYDREFDIFHGGSRTACTQDVLVDPRGYIYITGTNDGIWIVKENS